MSQTFTISVAIVLALFGIITLLLSGYVILDLFGVRAREAEKA